MFFGTHLWYWGKAWISSSSILSGVNALALGPSWGWLKGWRGSNRRDVKAPTSGEKEREISQALSTLTICQYQSQHTYCPASCQLPLQLSHSLLPCSLPRRHAVLWWGWFLLRLECTHWGTAPGHCSEGGVCSSRCWSNQPPSPWKPPMHGGRGRGTEQLPLTILFWLYSFSPSFRQLPTSSSFLWQSLQRTISCFTWCSSMDGGSFLHFRHPSTVHCTHTGRYWSTRNILAPADTLSPASCSQMEFHRRKSVFPGLLLWCVWGGRGEGRCL